MGRGNCAGESIACTIHLAAWVGTVVSSRRKRKAAKCSRWPFYLGLPAPVSDSSGAEKLRHPFIAHLSSLCTYIHVTVPVHLACTTCARVLLFRSSCSFSCVHIYRGFRCYCCCCSLWSSPTLEVAGAVRADWQTPWPSRRTSIARCVATCSVQHQSPLLTPSAM